MIELCLAIADDRCEAFAYDIPSWGLWAEGPSEESVLAEVGGGVAWAAFAQFLRRHGESPRTPSSCDIRIIERRRVKADEEAFERDYHPTTDEELNRTLQVLDWARSDLSDMLSQATDEELDWDDPNRVLPDWAWWRTARQMALHIALTESHYYLRNLGIAPPVLPVTPGDPPTTADVQDCLRRSGEHVRQVLPRLPRNLSFAYESGQVWTTTKSTWRLACHERGENDVIRHLLAKARAELAQTR